MRIFSGFYIKDDQCLVHTQYDIAINSCGRYELVQNPSFITTRPHGREDFQLLFIARGKALIRLNGTDQVVTEGHLVIYYPGEEQFYSYELEDHPVIYWIHFSGFDTFNLLQANGLINGSSLYVGDHRTLTLIFDKIITELNLERTHYFETCNLYVKELLLLSSRYLLEASETKYHKNEMLEQAIKYFNENFHQSINIKTYADAHNISCCWFIRHFKNYTGTTPTHYITLIRINKAKNLLIHENLSINQIASIVGYDNPLYFSRIFKKYVGVSPKYFFKVIN